MDFDLNKDPHIDLKADISHSDELLRSIPLEVLEGAQSAQKESFMMRLQGMPWMLKKMLYFFYDGLSYLLESVLMGVHFHMPRIAAAAASFVLLARRAHVFFCLIRTLGMIELLAMHIYSSRLTSSSVCKPLESVILVHRSP